MPCRSRGITFSEPPATPSAATFHPPHSSPLLLQSGRADPSPQALLDQLARHSLRFSAPTHLVVSCAAVAYHAHLQFAGPKLLEDIRVASGRTGPVAAEEAQARLAAWMSARPRRTRDVFAHAAMLFTLMGRFVFE